MIVKYGLNIIQFNINNVCLLFALLWFYLLDRIKIYQIIKISLYIIFTQ
jgi:hypothetical protein